MFTACIHSSRHAYKAQGISSRHTVHALLAVGGLWQTRKKLYRAWPGGQLRMVLPRFNLRNNDVTSEELLQVLDLVDSDFARMMDGWRRYVQRRKHEFWDNWDKTYGKTAVLAWGSRLLFRYRLHTGCI